MDDGAHDGTVRDNVLLHPSRFIIETERAISQFYVAPVRDLNSNTAEDLPTEIGAGAETADIAVEIQEPRPRKIVAAAQAKDRVCPCLRATGIHALRQPRSKDQLGIEAIYPSPGEHVEESRFRIDDTIIQRDGADYFLQYPRVCWRMQCRVVDRCRRSIWRK